jgi:hypothetical protein
VTTRRGHQSSPEPIGQLPVVRPGPGPGSRPAPVSDEAVDVSARLAKVLRPWMYPEDGNGGHLYRERMATMMAERVTAALLPEVRQLCALRAAEELEAAAADFGPHARLYDTAYIRGELRARAAALRGEAGL